MLSAQAQPVRREPCHGPRPTDLYAPGYVIEAVTSARGTAFDVVRCPVERYFRAHDAADLCVAAWCNLDYPLSEFTRQKRVRTLTLVQGDDHCDFRVFPAGADAHAVSDARGSATTL
jgi:hypothetical protein